MNVTPGTLQDYFISHTVKKEKRKRKKGILDLYIKAFDTLDEC